VPLALARLSIDLVAADRNGFALWFFGAGIAVENGVAFGGVRHRDRQIVPKLSLAQCLEYCAEQFDCAGDGLGLTQFSILNSQFSIASNVTTISRTLQDATITSISLSAAPNR
jgi:hypothetical protein